jgi:hypothetical protein
MLNCSFSEIRRLYGVVERRRRFVETYCLNLRFTEIKAPGPSELSLLFYQSADRHMSEENNISA